MANKGLTSTRKKKDFLDAQSKMLVVLSAVERLEKMLSDLGVSVRGVSTELQQKKSNGVLLSRHFEKLMGNN